MSHIVFNRNNKDIEAMHIVSDYVNEHITDSEENYGLYIVWKAKVLQNWKYLIASDMQDNMYYEVTYNGDKNEWYLDAYRKIENKVIKGLS